MGPAPRTVRFYFDYISSNAYLAWIQLRRIAPKHGIAVEPVPVLFAGLLEAHGQLGPAEVGPKARWMWRENLREAALLGVPLEMPRHHPFNPLLALRVSSLPLDPAAREALVGALFQAVWVRRLHVSEPEVVAKLADEVGLGGGEVIAAARTPASKDRLRRQTHDAIAADVFGIPTMIVDDQLFWGYDDLRFLELYLEGRDPLDPEVARRWAEAVTPSAMRRQVRERGGR